MFNANISDAATAVGYVHIIKRDVGGNVIEESTFKNQLTLYARTGAANLWAGIAIPVPSMIQVGVGSPTAPITGVTPNDTALWSPMTGTMKQCDFATVWLNYNTQYSVTYQATDAIGSWTELGLFDVTGNLWSHVQISNFSKNSGETVTVQWQIQHVGN